MQTSVWPCFSGSSVVYFRLLRRRSRWNITVSVFVSICLSVCLFLTFLFCFDSAVATSASWKMCNLTIFTCLCHCANTKIIENSCSTSIPVEELAEAAGTLPSSYIVIVYVCVCNTLCKLFWQDCALRMYRILYQVNMYLVSSQGIDKRMINVHYYYYYYTQRGGETNPFLFVLFQ